MGTCYDGSTPRGLHLRAVVTRSGNLVAKNYDSRKLIEESTTDGSGDIGVCVRVDGCTEALEPAQKAALQSVTNEMTARLLARVGITSDHGFAPGMVVEANSENGSVIGYVEKQADGGLYLGCFTNEFDGLKRVFVPMSMYMVEEVPGRFGLDGLFLEFLQTDREGLLSGSEQAEKAIQRIGLSVDTLREILESLQRLDGYQWHPSAYDHYIEKILDRIGDEERMYRIVKEWLPDKGMARSGVCAATLKRITKPEYIVELMGFEHFPFSSIELIDRVTDKDHLKVIARTCDNGMRDSALSRIDDAARIEVFEWMRSEESPDHVLQKTIASIEDSAWLEAFLMDVEQPCSDRLFAEAFGCLNDPAAVLRVIDVHLDRIKDVCSWDERARSFGDADVPEKRLQIFFRLALHQQMKLTIIRSSTDIDWLKKLKESYAATPFGQACDERLKELEGKQPQKKRVRK